MKKVNSNLVNVTIVAVLVASLMFIVNVLFPGALTIKPVVRGVPGIEAVQQTVEAVEAVEEIAVGSAVVEVQEDAAYVY